MAAFRRADRGGDWWIDFRYRGRRIRKRAPVQTKRAAEAFERTLRNELVADEEAGRDPFAGPPPTFAEFAERWMREYVLVRNRDSVQRDKRMTLENHLVPAFGDVQLSDITVAMIDGLAAKLTRDGLKPKTVNNTLSALHTALATAVDWGLLRSVPRFHWLPVPEPRFRFLTDAEERALLAVVPDGFWRALIVFFLHTGVRFSEAAGLQWQDLALDRDTPVVHVRRGGARGKPGETKTGSHRDLPLTRQVIAELERLPRESELVFPKPDGGMMNPASKVSYLYRFCDWADVKRFGWHVFRHTYATRMAAAGTPIHVLQRLLGHTTIKMTMRYVHVDAMTLASTVDIVSRALPIPERNGTPAVTGHPPPFVPEPQLAPAFC
jgi:integrase